MKPYIEGQLQADVEWIKRQLSNHLDHHQKWEVALIVGVLLMVIGALLK